jgi:DNA-binding SARP family transcriptional activator
LYYLAIEKRVQRDALRSLFWPNELDEKKSRGNLRVALNRLRGELPDPALLEITPDYVSLNMQRVRVDALQFMEQSIQPLRTAAQLGAGQSLPERLALQLRQAVDLWRSPHLLEGFNLADDNPDLDHWQTTALRRYQEAYLRVLNCLIDHAARNGDLDNILLYAQIGLAIDPLQVELHERVLQGMLSQTQYEAAASYAQSLITRFEMEGEEVPLSLSELCDRALEHHASDTRRNRAGGSLTNMLSRVPLVGANETITNLLADFRRGGAVVLWGETGAGKTRLISEFLNLCQPRPRLLMLNAFQGETNLPYQPLIDALRRDVTQAEWERLPRSWRKQIAKLLLELEEAEPGLTAGKNKERSEPELQPGQLFEVLRMELTEISKASRLVVVLDNAHWCDEATFAALAYLEERRFFNEHGLLLIAARSEEKAPNLFHFIDKYRASSSFHQIFIAPFDAQKTAELASHVLDHPVDCSVLQPLVEATGGTPLFLLEMLFALMEYAPGDRFNPLRDRLPISSSLHTMLRERMARLEPQTRQVAIAAAALGIDFDQVLLEKVTPFEAETVAQALDELQLSGLIKPSSEPSGLRYRFTYAMARYVIEKEQGPARLRLLHLRAARALEANSAGYQGNLDALLAQQFEEGGEALTAIRYWLKAAQHAKQSSNASEALKIYAAVERLVGRLEGALPADLSYPFYSQWGELAAERHDLELMRQVYGRMLQVGEGSQDSQLIGSALAGLAELAEFQQDEIRAQDLYERGAFHLEQVGAARALARLYFKHSGLLLMSTRFHEAIEKLEKARAAASESDDTTLTGVQESLLREIEYGLGMAYNITGWPLKAQEIAKSALRGEPSTASMNRHLVLSSSCYYLDELLASLEHARLGRQSAQSLGNSWVGGVLLIFQTRAELALGQVETAWKHCQEAEAEARAQNQSSLLGAALMLEGDVVRLFGDHLRAIRIYREAIKLSTAKWDSLTAQHHMAIALADAGSLEEGIALAQDTYLRARALEYEAVANSALVTLSMLLAITGRADQAAACQVEWIQLYRERQFNPPEIVEGWAMSFEPLSPKKLAEDTLQRARECANPWWELHAYRRLKAAAPLTGSDRARIVTLQEDIRRSVRQPDLVRMLEPFLRANQDILIEL